MAKEMRCGDVVPGCEFVAHGKTEAEVMAVAAEHARTAHQITEVSPALMAKVKAAIHDA
jgi:predicted small metal-binding protein